MKYLACLAAILLLGQVTGCATLLTPPGNANDQIDHWLRQEEYGKALAVAAELEETPSPAIRNLQAIRKKIDAQIASYEQQAMAKAERAVAVSDWGTAFALYREALRHLPDSTLLERGQQRLRARHAEHLQKLELERLIAKGEWTLKDLEVGALAAADSSWGWLGQYFLNRKLASASDLAVELAEHGHRAFERRDLTLAQQLLAAAMSLVQAIQARASDARSQGVFKETETRILTDQQRIAEAQSAPHRMPPAQPREQGRSVMTSPAPTNARRLIADLKKAYREKNLVEAQRLMSELESERVESPELEKLSRQLATDIARHVSNLIEIGATHYSQQRYEEAMDVWKQAHALDPDNEQVNARIKRVTRVLEKLQTLRDKSPPSE